MENLAPDEKSTLVMIYTLNMLIRGEVITKENTRVDIWPRTQGIPNFTRILKASVVLFGGSAPKSLAYAEILAPTAAMIGFHLAPPAAAPLDYDEKEKNRSMAPVSILLGTFIVKGHMRIATSTSISSYLDVVYNSWLSIYQAEISNPYLPQMPPMPVPMLLVSPNRVAFMPEPANPLPA